MPHLTRLQREQFQVLRTAGHTQKEIAHLIGCHQSTVSREFHRGKTPVYCCYNAEKAQLSAEERREQSYETRSCWYDNPIVLEYVVGELREGKSPDAIAGRMKRESPWHREHAVSRRGGSGAVATFVERFSKYFQAVLLQNQTAGEMVRAATEVFSDIPEAFRLTMTYDNGSEIVKHEEITAALNIVVYCAQPYRAWQRGLNEQTNGLLRRFFPKGTDFSVITSEELAEAVEKINNRPRRSLHYLTPKEVFLSEIKEYAFQG